MEIERDQRYAIVCGERKSIIHAIIIVVRKK